MKYYILSLTFLIVFVSNAQDSLVVDERYREDQFYASISYNIFSNAPEGISQNGFSTGFHFGFIRDMPFNKRRNWSLGLGLGLSSNSYNQDLIITETTNGIVFNASDDTLGDISKNRFTTYLVEIPLELRWRTSTATDYKFWRIYTGFKLGYLVYNSTKLRSDNLDNNLSNIDEFNTLQYGLTLSAGYGTWNFQLYYGLNSIFDNSVQLNDASIDARSIKIGIIFYIL